MATRFRNGQAFVEMAIGMLALALVLSALFGFADCILRSLDQQRRLRAEAGMSAMGSIGGDGSFASAADADTVEVEPLAAEYIFGTQSVRVEESVHIPILVIASEQFEVATSRLNKRNETHDEE